MKPVRLFVCLIAAMAVTAGCLSTDRTIYDVACKAVKADAKFPTNGVISPMDKCGFYVARNAACVEVYYEFVNASGATESDSYIVWVKRIARRWELDRCFPTPKYSQPFDTPLK